MNRLKILQAKFKENWLFYEMIFTVIIVPIIFLVILFFLVNANEFNKQEPGLSKEEIIRHQEIYIENLKKEKSEIENQIVSLNSEILEYKKKLEEKDKISTNQISRYLNRNFFIQTEGDVGQIKKINIYDKDFKVIASKEFTPSTELSFKPQDQLNYESNTRIFFSLTSFPTGCEDYSFECYDFLNRIGAQDMEYGGLWAYNLITNEFELILSTTMDMIDYYHTFKLIDEDRLIYFLEDNINWINLKTRYKGKVLFI